MLFRSQGVTAEVEVQAPQRPHLYSQRLHRTHQHLEKILPCQALCLRHLQSLPKTISLNCVPPEEYTPCSPRIRQDIGLRIDSKVRSNHLTVGVKFAKCPPFFQADGYISFPDFEKFCQSHETYEVRDDQRHERTAVKT